MTRMIERWFPCAEVSEASSAGWGSGNTERNLFTWFAARPTAQAKAAVITSLLPWPDDEAEQRRLQDLVRRAMTGRYEAWDELRAEIVANNPNGGSVLDPFSGRGMIPLEAARLGLPSYGIEYAPVAVLASELLIDYPFRDWSGEPALPYVSSDRLDVDNRLLRDVEAVLSEIGRRHEASMSEFYPPVAGKQPWGYLWAVTLPCQECGRRFPLVGSFELRKPNARKQDVGQSFFIDTNLGEGTFEAVVHDGAPRQPPTLVARIGADGKKGRGKSAVCPFCDHVHPLSLHQRLAGDGCGRDVLLVVADIDDDVGKRFRVPTSAEQSAAESARQTLDDQESFGAGLPAIPDELIPENNGATIRPQLYGATTYGDLMVARQTLSFVKLAREIAQVGEELASFVSRDYARALTGYAAAVLVRKLRRSTRGTTLDVSRLGLNHIFMNETGIAFSYDSFESGLGDGPGTWRGLSASSLTTLKSLLTDVRGVPGQVQRGTADALPYRDGSMGSVVTDPPYDAMVYYTDSSDLIYAWLKRALSTTHPEVAITSDPRGLQEKSKEAIVKEHGRAPGEHRDRQHYDSMIAASFAEMRRVVADDGLVTIVFGHGEPEVWHRLLGAISSAGLVMTGSWPARTESGGQQGKANIVTTLTMPCRTAPVGRPDGRAGVVESEVKTEVKARMPLWERSGLAPTDMLMASAGPAMEVVGRYEQVLDSVGNPVEPDRYLITARQAVQEAAALEIDNHPLETFDARTRFAVWWVKLYGRQVAAKSELRWQALAADLDLSEVRDLVPDADKGCRFVAAKDFKRDVSPESSVIDVALALARAWPDGLDAVGEVLAGAGRDAEDSYLWGAIAFLADRIPDADTDAIAWTGLVRNRKNVGAAAKGAVDARRKATKEAEDEEAKLSLF